MAEHFHDDSHLHSLREQQRRTGVTHVVEADPADARCRDVFVEGAPQVARFDGRTKSRGEDETGLRPPLTCCSEVSLLNARTNAQCGSCLFGQGERAFRSCRLGLSLNVGVWVEIVCFSGRWLRMLVVR